MSILVVVLLVGVAAARKISYYDDDIDGWPMPDNWRETRICAELCISGLGGEPCGPSCVALTPLGPRKNSDQDKSSNISELLDGQTKTTSIKNSTAPNIRNNVCSTLCSNNLGNPLCKCDYTKKPFKIRVNYIAVCKKFCENSYRLFGCQPCEILSKIDPSDHTTSTQMPTSSSTSSKPKLLQRFAEVKLKLHIDPEKWCPKVCQEGDGGAACSCDLPPLLMVN